ncbi:MAG: hypothetical protein M3136_08605 [Thermoproteota archaeon]|nr:hypothetical protein [Thermoproteota archaeon]
MTTPSEEQEEMEKELSHILDEIEAIINDPSESTERKKEAQMMIQRAVEKGSSISKTKSGQEELRKRYVYITRMYFTRQIQKLEVIKETLKRQMGEEESSPPPSRQRAKELERDLEECDRTIESHRKFLEKLEYE